MIPENFVHYWNAEVDQNAAEHLRYEKPWHSLTQSFVFSATIADSPYLVIWYVCHGLPTVHTVQIAHRLYNGPTFHQTASTHTDPTATYHFTHTWHSMQESQHVLKVRQIGIKKIWLTLIIHFCLRHFRVCEATLENSCLLSLHTKLLFL